ncbi:AmmeMemoRadiSam system radical SAM enzyme [bacterium]|nr:AmmeMemoRadiSam system radical SAM enzyme [bacterium]
MKTAFTRRRFLAAAAAAAAGGLTSPAGRLCGAERPAGREARHYRRLAGNKVQCGLCPWECLVDDGKRGKCGVRENRGGRFYSLVYGRVAASHVDPIEKKPFYHLLPGSPAYSMATVGCNFDCRFCQNWDLARRRPEEAPVPELSAESVAEAAARARCPVIAFTYSEPTVFNEFAFDTAAAGRRLGIRSVVVSNGFIRREPLEDLCGVIDGYKVDLKSMDDRYYRSVCSGRLAPVLETLVRLRDRKVWCEIVYLVVPTLNDSDAGFRMLSQWVLKEMGPDVPVHFSRFYPQYKLNNLPPTPAATLERAWSISREAGLHFVYLGNLPGHEAENTFCPGCHKAVILRSGFSVKETHLRDGRCGFCGRVIPGVWA